LAEIAVTGVVDVCALDDPGGESRWPALISRSDAIQGSGEPEALHNRCTATHVFGALALGTALDGASREHAVLAAQTTSRSGAIQSSGKPEALHNRCTANHVFGALALGTALDGACSEARRSSRSSEFPLRREPKLRRAGSTP